MQNAYRWYLVKSNGKPLPPTFCAKAVRVSGQDFWFSRGPSGDDGALRFYKRIQIPVERIGSSGDPETSQIESISSVEIAFKDGRYGTLLKVTNPGRNMRSLMDSLEFVLGSGFSTRPLGLDSADLAE